MMSSLLDKILGRPLKSSETKKEELGVATGVPVLGLDALASTAYGPEAALTILVPLGMTGLHYMPMVTIGILALLATLYMSYRQTAATYPGGGGAYIVAKDNLGMGAGVAAGHGATAGLHAQRCRWNLSRGRRSPVGSSN